MHLPREFEGGRSNDALVWAWKLLKGKLKTHIRSGPTRKRKRPCPCP